MLGVWWMVTSAGAQSYFNKRETLHSFANGITSVVESNGKYFTTGFALDSTNLYGPYNYGGGIRFSIWSKDGHLLSDTNFVLPFRDLDAFSNNLKRLSDGSFLMASYTQDTGGKFRQLIVNFDSTGHTVWYKEYDKPFCQNISQDFWRLEDFQATGTGEWLMLTTLNCPNSNGQTDYCLVKLDSAFNIIWGKKYGDPTNNNFGGKLLIDGNNYIMAGGMNTYNVLPNTTTYQAEIFRLDTAGNILKHILINNPNRTNTIKDIIKTHDGNYVYCGGGDGYESPPTPFFADVNFKGWVQKLDTAFNPIWSRSLNQYYYTTEFKKIMERPNGQLLVFGDKYDPVRIDAQNVDVHTKGWFIRLSANGDSLAERSYYAVRSCNDQNAVYDVKQTSDGGFILAGESTDRCSPLNPPVQRAWLLKVDSNGCSSANDPQCWAVSVPHSPTIAANEYKVYPNPVSDLLRIAYTNSSDKGAVLQIVDVVGRVMIESSLAGKTGSVDIDMRSLQSGVYLYHILENGKTVKTGRVTKH